MTDEVEMKRMSVTIEGEGFGKTETVWYVPAPVLRAYVVYYKTGNSVLDLGASKAVEEAKGDYAQAAANVLGAARDMSA